MSSTHPTIQLIDPTPDYVAVLLSRLLLQGITFRVVTDARGGGSSFDYTIILTGA